MKLLHQCGHCTSWNVKSLTEDGAGDGLIFSPVHENRAKVESYPSTLRRVSLFDPQFYLPNSQKQKLHSYPFFPEFISNGYNTTNFSMVALEAAKICVQFQLEQAFDKIVIPARFFSQMITDYSAKQETYAVIPFLREISRQKIKKPILLTLPLTSHMVEDSAYRTEILNWVTSFPEVSGIYLIVSHDRQTKQVTSKIFLQQMLEMLTALKKAGLEVVVGYANTESLLYLVAGEIDITMGAYENTRMFSIDKFLDSDEDRRGPRARIYLPGLLNWIQFGQAQDIRNADSEIWKKIHDPTKYSEAVLKQLAEPRFNQSPLYMHYFLCFQKQVSQLSPLSRKDRFKHLARILKEAIETNDTIREIPVALEKHGDGDHLQVWLDVLNNYFRIHLK